MEPLITVITPSYNQGRFIEQTILSVLNQSYKNLQYIIVDGGSTDETMDIIEKYKDRIDTIIHEKDKGQSDAINKGFKLAKGELVGWINSDDILYTDCLERIVKLYTAKPDGAIYYNAFNNNIDKNGTIIKTYARIIPDRNYLLNKNCAVIQQGSFYKTQIVKTVGYLNKEYHYCMDLDLWLKLLDLGEIFYINDGRPSSGFRRWGEAKTSTGGKYFNRELLKVLKKSGMNTFSANNLRLNWWLIKSIIKGLIK